jgi:hypothetical protein
MFLVILLLSTFKIQVNCLAVTASYKNKVLRIVFLITKMFHKDDLFSFDKVQYGFLILSQMAHCGFA